MGGNRGDVEMIRYSPKISLTLGIKYLVYIENLGHTTLDEHLSRSDARLAEMMFRYLS